MGEKAKVLVEFRGKGAEDAARGFLDWLCGQGEQDYWTYMECQDGVPTAYKFDYNVQRLRADASMIEDSGADGPEEGRVETDEGCPHGPPLSKGARCSMCEG